jgi:long-subunit acyl-CoA synthetase (AMP-forming)
MKSGGQPMTAEQFFARLRAHPGRDPAVQGETAALSYRALLGQVDALADVLLRAGVRTLATRLANGPAWIVADLAALRAGIVHLPLPQFFTAEQQAFALRAAGADAVLEPAAGAQAAVEVAGESLALRRRLAAVVRMPDGTRKVTFTSGTTATPKGVCLGESMLDVADGLREALSPLALRRHLCALPLPVLLENIAGVYAPLLAGGTVVALPAERVGLTGSSSFDPATLDAAARRHGADSLITLPQMLRAWSGWRRASGAAPLPELKFVAVGGAYVGAAAIAQARLAGLPAFEGYGLSEAASVQTLNLPHADRPGSAGRTLPHARLRIGDDGQVCVAGALMLGYLGGGADIASQWWATGDLGRIDGDGFLHLAGRSRNVLITAYGRNVSPEWVEAELQAEPSIAHAAVFGDGEPCLAAVLWPSRIDGTDRQLDAAVTAANARLPDYARIGGWIRARVPFSAAAGTTTANGRPRREAIAAAHAAAPEAEPRTEFNPPLESYAVSRPTVIRDR